MDSKTRINYLQLREKLHDDIERLNKIKTDNLDFKTSVAINERIKRLKKEYNIINALLTGNKE